MKHLRRAALLLGALALVARASHAGAAGTPADALVGKVLACYEAEGGVSTPEDKAAVLAFADELVAALGLSACEGGVECTDAIAALSCADLTKNLVPDLATLAGPIEPWARAFGDAVVARSSRCATTEDASVDASTADYAALGAAVGATLSSLVAAESCTVDASAQAACLTAIQAVSCERLASSLGLSAPDAGGGSLLDLCPGFLRCGENVLRLEAP
jgi:hypothetical protein